MSAHVKLNQMGKPPRMRGSRLQMTAFIPPSRQLSRSNPLGAAASIRRRSLSESTILIAPTFSRRARDDGFPYRPFRPFSEALHGARGVHFFSFAISSTFATISRFFWNSLPRARFFLLNLLGQVFNALDLAVRILAGGL